MLRSFAVAAALVLAGPGFAQEQKNAPDGQAAANIILFLKSPDYAEVESTATRAAAKDIDASWCQAGADLSTFAWAGEFASISRGNNPLPLVHAIMTDAAGHCQYFVVYTSLYAVSLELGNKLAAWTPSVPRRSAPPSQAAAAKPVLPSVSPPVTQVVALPAPRDTATITTQPQSQSQSPEQGTALDAPLPRPRPQDADLKKQDADGKKPTPVAKPKARAVALAPPRPATATPGTAPVRPVRAQ